MSCKSTDSNALSGSQSEISEITENIKLPVQDALSAQTISTQLTYQGKAPSDRRINAATSSSANTTTRIIEITLRQHCCLLHSRPLHHGFLPGCFPVVLAVWLSPCCSACPACPLFLSTAGGVKIIRSRSLSVASITAGSLAASVGSPCCLSLQMASSHE